MQVELIGGSALCTKHFDALVMKAADDGGPHLVAMVSTDSIDSEGDVIHQGKNKNGDGWVLARFNKAPVLTWGHEIWRPNISAPSTRAKVAKRHDGEKGTALYLNPFAFDMEDPFAASIAGKYERGVLRETSVGFIGRKFDKRVDGERVTGRDYWEQELLEVASVNRGANQDTTTHMKSLIAGGMSALVEGGADNEVRELKDEIAHLTNELKMVANEVKRISDALVIKTEPVTSERERAAAYLLKRLREVGTAY